MAKIRLFKDILTEQCPDGTRAYSQGRFYLLWSVLAYYITLGFMTVKSLKPDVNISVETLSTIIEALQWSMGLFAGYAFGGKAIDIVKTIFSKAPTASEAPAVTPKSDELSSSDSKAI